MYSTVTTLLSHIQMM